MEVNGSSADSSNPGLQVDNVIRTMRNASAHLPDLVGDKIEHSNISFPEGCCVRFTSFGKGRNLKPSVTFRTETGFVKFLGDYLRAVQKLVNKKCLKPAPGQPILHVVN